MHDPHQAGGGLRGEDDTAIIELHRDKHDQAAEQTQRLVEPETHVPTPFLPAGKSIITQPRGKNNPPRAVFLSRAADAGRGIGTVVSALIVGPLVSLFDRVLPGLGRIRALAIS